jgi:hypothetical protein
MGTYDIKELWIEYEKIAMHFNDLLIRLRTQSLGGLSAIAAIVSVLVNSHASPGDQNLYMCIMFAALTVAWGCTAIIDLTYYDRMLRGAVGAIHELEKLSETSQTASSINLSTRITQAVTHKKIPIESSPWYTGRSMYYLLIGVGLVVLTIAFGAAAAGWIGVHAAVRAIQ